MREFSKFEKEVIKKMIDIHKRDEKRGDIVGTLFPVLFGSIDLFRNTVFIRRYDNKLCLGIDKKASKDQCSKIIRRFYQLIFLLITLRDEKYVFFDESFDDWTEQFDNIKENESPHTINKSLYTIVKSFFVSCLFITEELTSIEKRKFKTSEQVRFEEQLNDIQKKHDEAMRTANDQVGEARKQTKNSRRALYVSWGALGVSVFATVWTICSSYNTIRDVEQIIQNNKLILPAVIETKITNDTIKVDVVKPTPINRISNDPSK